MLGLAEPGSVPLALISLAFVALIALPMIFTVYGVLSASPPGSPFSGLSLAALHSVYGGTRYLPAIRTSLLIGAVTAIAGTFIGGAFAWLLGRTDVPFKGLLRLMLIGTFGLPPVLSTVSWVALLAPGAGFLNVLFDGLFHHQLMNIYSLPGILLVTVFVFSPFAYLILAGPFIAVSAEEEGAASVHGANLLRVLRHVTLPSVWPSLVTSAVLLFVISAQTFSIPLILGEPARITAVPEHMYRGLISGLDSPAETTAIGTLLLWPGLLAFVWALRSSRRAGLLPRTSRATRGEGMSLGRLRYLAFALAGAYVLVTFATPVVALVLGSFLKYLTPHLSTSLLTLGNYRALFGQSNARLAILNTILMAVGGATLGTVVSLLLAYSISRFRSWISTLANVASILPLALPRLELALGFLWAFTALPVVNRYSWSLPLITLAVIVGFMGIGVQTLVASLTQLSRDLDESASTSGAGFWTRLLVITTPLLTPTLVSVWRTFFILCVLEVDVVIFLYQSPSVTLSVLTFVNLDQGSTAMSFPLGVAQLAIVAAMVILSSGVQRLLRVRGAV